MFGYRTTDHLKILLRSPCHILAGIFFVYYSTANSIAMKQKVCAVYCRISIDRENQKSIKEQELSGREFCESKLYTPDIYIDQGISGGGDTGKRPAFTKLINNIKKGKIHAVYVNNQDRLAREELTWFAFMETLLAHDVILYEDGKQVDLEDESTRMLGGFKAIMDASYRRTTSKKIKAILLRNVQEGKATGIHAYGYKTDEQGYLVVDPDEAVVVLKIFELAAKGMGAISIANYLNEEGVPTRYNRIAEYGKDTFIQTNQYTKESEVRSKSMTKWGQSTIRGILHNTKYIGQRVYNGEMYKCPKIIPQKLWDKVNATFEGGMPRGKRTEYKYLLNGLLYCGQCGRRMTGRTKGGDMDRAVYRCVGKRYHKSPELKKCDNRDILLTVMDQIIWRRLFLDKRMLESIEEHLQADMIDKRIDVLKSERSQLSGQYREVKKKAKRAVELVIDGIVDRSQLRGTLESFDKEQKELETKIKKLDQEISYRIDNKRKAEDVKDELEELEDNAPFNLQQKLIVKYIKKIRMLYSERAYHIIISFHLNIPDEKLVIDTKYNAAVEQTGSIMIPISDDYREKFKGDLDWQTDPVINRLIRSALNFSDKNFYDNVS